MRKTAKTMIFIILFAVAILAAVAVGTGNAGLASYYGLVFLAWVYWLRRADGLPEQ